MKAMLYADWMNLRRSMKAMVIAIVVIALASIFRKRAVVCAGYAVHAVTHGARNAHEQRLCLRMG